MLYSKQMQPSEKVQQYLLALLGANTSRIAVRIFCEKIGKRPEDLLQADLPKLAQSMAPMLTTLLGSDIAAKAVREISSL